MEFIPLALGCGHIAKGFVAMEIDGIDEDEDGRLTFRETHEPPRAECPEGCGMQEFVIEP